MEVGTSADPTDEATVAADAECLAGNSEERNCLGRGRWEPTGGPEPGAPQRTLSAHLIVVTNARS